MQIGIVWKIKCWITYRTISFTGTLDERHVEIAGSLGMDMAGFPRFLDILLHVLKETAFTTSSNDQVRGVVELSLLHRILQLV